MPRRSLSVSLAVMLLALPLASFAEETPAKETGYTLTLKDHTFTPAEIKVPANTKFTLVIRNEDNAAEEFESEDLEIEKVIPGNTEGKVIVPALDAGAYSFVGEFHEDSAKGKIIAE